MYEFDSRIRYSEVDSNQNLTVLGLIDYFQDCSTFQSEDLGIGVDYLNEHQLGWVVVSYHVTIERLPRLGEHICIQTFPYNLKGMFGSRNYAMLDDSGSQVACANSLWVLVDLTTGKPTRIPEAIGSRYELGSPFAMEKTNRKILLPESAVCEEPVPVQRYFLDTNHHMNNGKYIMVALSYLPPDFPVASFRVEYRNQAHLGDLLHPYVASCPDRVIISLCNEAKIPFASLEFHRKAEASNAPV